ncbi:DUF488 family protein [Gordonia aurantiaca]
MPDLLQASGIELVVDVRKLPDRSGIHASTRTPWHRIRQTRESRIGGRRASPAGAPNRDVPIDVNDWWSNRSFHNYADHALSDTNSRAPSPSCEKGFATRAVPMCSEAVWWRGRVADGGGDHRGATGASSPIICSHGTRWCGTSWLPVGSRPLG